MKTGRKERRNSNDQWGDLAETILRFVLSAGKMPELRQSLTARLTLTTQNGYLTRHHRGPSAAFKNMEEKLSFIQRLIRHLPGNWPSDMEAESRKWIARCRECGSEKSLWDHGGIRWKAAGSPSTRLVCGPCGRITWHQINYQDKK